MQQFIRERVSVLRHLLNITNWFIRAENSTYFDRKWLRGEHGERVRTLQDLPKNCIAVRGIDRAYKEPHEGNTSPNYTAFSPLVLKDREGQYWLLGNYHTECIDKPYRKSDKPVKGRIRRNPGERNNIIVKQCNLDKKLADQYGYKTPVLAMSEESGAGAGDYTSLKARLDEESIKTSKDVKQSNVEGKKLSDFLAFSEACQDRRVYIIEETFPQDTLDAYYKELEIFDGVTKSTRTRFDDFVDSTSIAFNVCKCSSRPYTTIIRNQRRSETLSASIKRD